jgi:HD-like signal output (HDOD) protein/ActR/RegA family two-component response regulator
VKRILFVDDVPAVLGALRKLLHAERGRWRTCFATGGHEALEQLAEAPVDVIVSDMRMSGMDGVSLLERVRDRYPDVIRIVLTGYSDTKAVARASAVAHRWVLKPCPWEDLRSLLERSCALQDLLKSEALRRTVGGLGTLPAAPRTYHALTEALSDPDVELERLASIVEQDIGMTSRVLQFVNSAYFGFAQRVTGIEAAIVALGRNPLRHLALTFEVFAGFRGGLEAEGLSFNDLEAHALLTARLARRLVTETEQANSAFAAGLLHDAGRLVLMSRMPEAYGDALRHAQARGIALHQAEKELLGADHAEVGAYLLGIWGLPHAIVEPVAFHHTPARFGAGAPVMEAIGHADALAHEARPVGPPGVIVVAPEQIERLNRAAQAKEWRELAAREMQKE